MVAAIGRGNGLGSRFLRLRPSGPPLAPQRRAISVVEGQNGEDCDHADPASGGHCGAGVSPAGCDPVSAIVCIAPVSVHQLRPSGPPMAPQRRAISVVEGQNGEDCDPADHASGGLMASLERCSQRFRRGLPGMTMCGRSFPAGGIKGAHCQTRHAPVCVVFRVLSRCWF